MEIAFLFPFQLSYNIVMVKIVRLFQLFNNIIHMFGILASKNSCDGVTEE